MTCPLNTPVYNVSPKFRRKFILQKFQHYTHSLFVNERGAEEKIPALASLWDVNNCGKNVSFLLYCLVAAPVCGYW